MSTLVLARKYRPRSFDQMVGQEHVVRALSNALEQKRLHHAYLFTGTRGVGKTTVSRILAKSLNCTGEDGHGDVTARPCGRCTACTEIDADRYIDYIELDAASNRGIAEVQDLIERAAYKPGIGRYKVFMIDEAHQLTKDAFNALLKTLEEPPEYLKFVLATTDPEKMLPTVLSRCLQFNLRPMAPEVVREHLARVLRAESVTSDEASLRLLSRAARGSMRDALSLADQAIAYGGGRLDEVAVRAMLGSVDRGHAQQLVQALADRDGAALLARVDTLRELGLSPAGTLEEMAQLLQQMAVAAAVPDALDASDPDHDAARALAPLLAADETHLLYSMVLHGRAELGLMGDEYAALAMVLLRFLAFAPADAAAGGARDSARAAIPSRPAAPAAPAAPQGSGPAARSGAVPERPRPAAPAVRSDLPDIPPWVDEPPAAEGDAEPRSVPLRTTQPAARSVAAVQPIDADAGDEADAPPESTPQSDRWVALVRRLAEGGRIGALVRELAWQAGVRGVADRDDGGAVWTLVVERESLRQEGTRERLEAALSAELGMPQRLVIEPGVPADSAARRDAWERRRRQADAERMIRDDPAVTQLLAQFGTARIVPGSIKPI